MIVLKKQHEKLEPLLHDYHLDKLAPPKQAYSLHWTEQQEFKMVEKKKRRRIYFRTTYTEQQKNKLAYFIRMLGRQQTTKDYPEFFSQQVILKHLYGTDFDYEKTINRLKVIHKFITEEPESNFTDKSIKALQNGSVYTFGYDKKFRPLIMFRISKFNFDDSKEFTNLLYLNLYIAQRYRMVPYHAEKWNLFFDVCDYGVTEIPYLKLHDTMTKIGMLYTGNVEKIFVVNAEKISTLWYWVKKAIPSHALQNIVFATKHDQLYEYIDREQLEERYGGTNRDLIRFWPPTSPNSLQHQKEQFVSVINDTMYFTQEHYHTMLEDEQKQCNCHCLIF